MIPGDLSSPRQSRRHTSSTDGPLCSRRRDLGAGGAHGGRRGTARVARFEVAGDVGGSCREARARRPMPATLTAPTRKPCACWAPVCGHGRVNPAPLVDADRHRGGGYELIHNALRHDSARLTDGLYTPLDTSLTDICTLSPGGSAYGETGRRETWPCQESSHGNA